MDEYLMSLVRKDELVENEVANDATDEAAEDQYQDLAESDTSPEDIADEEASASTQNDDEASEHIAEDAVEDSDKIQEDVKEDSDDVSEPNTSVDLVNDDTHFIPIGAVLPVVNLKVFNVPDPKSVSKLLSGNVIYLGEVNEMDKIQYMKPGVGLVLGYANLP